MSHVGCCTANFCDVDGGDHAEVQQAIAADFLETELPRGTSVLRLTLHRLTGLPDANYVLLQATHNRLGSQAQLSTIATMSYAASDFEGMALTWPAAETFEVEGACARDKLA